MRRIKNHPWPLSRRGAIWLVASLLCVAALALPSPASAQFDFTDALVVKLRTYPVKRQDGKPVHGSDGMPQPEAVRGGRPVGLKELPAFPVDQNFPGGSILDALFQYHRRDPMAALDPVVALLKNGYLEMDIVKPCIVDAVKIQFEQKPTKAVPSFNEHGIASLMKILVDGTLAARLDRTSDRLRDRYNAGISTTPEADQNNMAALQVARFTIAKWYNPRVVSVAWKDLPPIEAKKRFKAEVLKGQPLETVLVMGPLRLAIRGKADRQKLTPPPAGCPGAHAAANRPVTSNDDGPPNPSYTPSVVRASMFSGPVYAASLKASLAVNGKGTNGHRQNGHAASRRAETNGWGKGQINSNFLSRILKVRQPPVPAYRASLKFDTWNSLGYKVPNAVFTVGANIGQNDANKIRDRWGRDRDDDLDFGYSPDSPIYNIDQGGTQVAAQPRGLIDWRLQGADQGIKAAIDHLTQIYNDRNKYNLTRDQIKGIAQTIYELTRLRYAWGTMTADDVWIWRRVWRQGMEPDAAREALEKLKKYGMKAEDLIAQDTEEQEKNYVSNSLNQQGLSQQQDQFQALYTQPQTPVLLSPVLLASTTVGDVPLITPEQLITIWFVREFLDIFDALLEGKLSFYEALDETTSLLEDVDYLRYRLATGHLRFRSGEDGVGTDGRPHGLYRGFGVIALNGNSWESSYSTLEGENQIGMPLWNYETWVASGPCIKGPESLKPDAGEEDEWSLRASVKFAFSPKTIGINTYTYWYGASGALGKMLGCIDAIVEENPLWEVDGMPNDPHFAKKGSWGQEYADQWALRRIGFTALEDKKSAWHITSGTERPVVVAVIDTGIDLTHPDIHIDNIWYNDKEIPGNDRDDDNNGYIDDLIGWNFVHNHNNPYDVVGHGTHVAGIIGAQWNNGRGIAGMNRGVRIMTLKAFNEVGKGWGSNVARAIVYAVNNGAKIINISASHEGHTKFLEHVFDWAKTKGALVVVSAGNKGINTKGVEAANQPGTLVVGATLPDDKRAPFSNWGQEVDVAAPGVDVLSLRATNTDIIPAISEDPSKVKAGDAIVGKEQQYYRAGGTSFSTPLVSGLASLIWAKNPKLTAEQVARMIVQSAQDIETPGWDLGTGFGLVDARGALTADPNWYLVAKIHALKGSQEGGQPVVQVVGTVEGSRLAGYEVSLGSGKEPKEWKTVRKKPAKKVAGDVLARLKPADFGAPGTWNVRLLVRDKGGRTRESQQVIELQ